MAGQHGTGFAVFNYRHRDCPGALFEVADGALHGPMMVITTAGYVFGPDLQIERVIDFRRHVDKVRDWMATVDGCLATRAFTPHTVGDDGYTFSVWRDEATMLNCAYRAGSHRTQLDRHKAENIFDRSSFTRFRILDHCGSWNGADLLEIAQVHSFIGGGFFSIAGYVGRKPVHLVTVLRPARLRPYLPTRQRGCVRWLSPGRGLCRLASAIGSSPYPDRHRA